MNYPRASCGVSKNIYESFPEVVTPKCLIGDPVRVSPGFLLQACRNDGLRGDSKSRLRSKLRGVDPMRLFFFVPRPGPSRADFNLRFFYGRENTGKRSDRRDGRPENSTALSRIVERTLAPLPGSISLRMLPR